MPQAHFTLKQINQWFMFFFKIHVPSVKEGMLSFTRNARSAIRSHYKMVLQFCPFPSCQFMLYCYITEMLL